VIQWTGPERGPYHPLSYGKVPGRLIPLAPVPIWVDLDDVVNKCFNKSAQQALRQKTVTFSNSPDDAERVRDAEDGDMVFTPQAGEVQEVNYGGANQQTLAMVIWAKQMLTYMGGNWDVLAGLSSQTDTVGQDQLLAAGASGRMKDMQQTTIEFQTGVIQDLAYWLWSDPISEYHLLKPVGQSGFTTPVVFSPESREGKFFDYQFKVNPYSLQNQTPQEEANKLIQMLTQFILPALPGLMQSGIMLNWEAVFKILAEKMNLPDLNSIIQYAQGQMLPQPEPPGMPASTSRTYNRTNTPGASQQGNDQNMIGMLLGGSDSVQPSQMASMLRPTG
jgi:hypothetical protein